MALTALNIKTATEDIKSGMVTIGLKMTMLILVSCGTMKHTKKKLPDYSGYAQDKRMIESMVLTPKEYETACKQAAARRGV